MKKCRKCNKELPELVRKISHPQRCLNCTRKEYYKRNRNVFLERSKNKRDKEREEKIRSGKYKWGTSQKAEEEKFKFFLQQNYIHIDVDLNA